MISHHWFGGGGMVLGRSMMPSCGSSSSSHWADSGGVVLGRSLALCRSLVLARGSSGSSDWASSGRSGGDRANRSLSS